MNNNHTLKKNHIVVLQAVLTYKNENKKNIDYLMLKTMPVTVF